jgi:polyisoprenoid-binding protein YceI
MKIAKISIFLPLLFYTGLFAQNLKVNSANMSFQTKMLGVKVVGTFKGFQGSVVFNPNDLALASIQGTVDASTIDTDNNLRNTHLKEKSDFFEVVKYPKLKMVSNKVERYARGYIGTFQFTIKTITKTIKIPFTYTESGNLIVLKGSTNINRKDWNIGGNTFGMSDDVVLNLVLNLSK